MTHLATNCDLCGHTKNTKLLNYLLNFVNDFMPKH